MKVASISVVPPAVPHSNRRRITLGSGASGIGFGQNTNGANKTSKINTLA